MRSDATTQLVARCLGAVLALVPLNAQTPEFEVAVVKPANPTGDRGTNISTSGDTVTLHNATLRFAIQAAYGVPEYRVFDGPDWVGSQRFEITGKSESPVAPRDLLLMLRSLLAERFQLRVRSEERETSVYWLVPAKSGVKIKVSDPDDSTPASLLGQPARGGIVGHRVTMKQLAATLSIGSIFGRPVLDRTGLVGEYDFTLEGFAPLLPGQEDNRPSFFTVLEEELGLKLEAGKDTVEVLIIEHAQQPSAN